MVNLEPKPDNEFEKQGVEFKIITEDMFEDVKTFMWENFFPDEPISRSLGIERNEFYDKYWLGDCLKKKQSIAAMKDGEILAVRLGVKKSRSQKMEKFMEWLMVKTMETFPFLKPSSLPKNLDIFIKCLEEVGFDTWKMFDQLGCDHIYEDKAVCSGRNHGIKGLGTEVCRRSEELAVDLGCSHTYAIVTGKYSEKIFDKLGHTTVNRLMYDEFRDKNGEIYLKDTREHTSCITCYRKLI